MTAFVERALDIDRAEANRLRILFWRRYGATLLGLVRHHGVDPQAFLHACHDFDVSALLRAERGLARLFRRLPGSKVLLSNAPLAYAGAVLRELALHRHIVARYTIERMRVHGTFRPMPSRLMLRAMLARERVPPAAAVLVEDSLVNLKSARSLGLRTVLIKGLHNAQIVRVVVSESPDKPDDPKAQWRPHNKRAEMWLTGRESLQPDPAGHPRLRLDVDGKCAAQLRAPLYGTNSAGKTVIETKDSMKSRGVSSPDRAEAVLLAVYEPKGKRKGRLLA